MFIRMLIAILCLGWVVVPSQTDEPPRSKPIDPKTIAAYEKIGAQYGGFAVDAFGSVRFTWIKEEAAQLLPGFCFLRLPDGVLAKMPPIEVAFGLDLHLPRATDAHLKELKGVKNLTMLDLHFTKVTDAGLKELKDLQDLAALDLRGTKVTDAGLQELKNLKNLKWLNLGGTKVTGAGLKDLKDFKSLVALYVDNIAVTDAEMKILKDLHLTTLRVEAPKDRFLFDMAGPATIPANLEPVAHDEFKMLVEQDAKNIVAWAEIGQRAVETKSKGKISSAQRALKSNAVITALAANSRISGKDATADAKLAALRDAAINVAKAAGARKFGDALKVGKTLSPNMANDASGAKAMPVADIVKATELDVDELMHQFKKTTSGGLGVEEDIKANAKRLTGKASDVAAMAQRVLVVSELCKVLQPQGGFSAAKPKNNWDRHTKYMQEAATELNTAAKANDVKILQAAFGKLDASCVACHEQVQELKVC